jgi:hypothetical protein
MDRPLPRSSLTATCLGHAAVFAWAAANLPWRSGTAFAVICSILTLLHVTTAVTALLRKPEWLVRVWRVLSVASALAFLVLGWSMAAAALYVSKLYLRLGPSVGSGILAAAAIVGLLTVPMAIWGARHTWPLKGRSARRLGAGGSLLVVLAMLSLPLAASAARATPVPLADAGVSASLVEILEQHSRREPGGKFASVAGAGSASCTQPVNSDRLTLFVSAVTKGGGATSACIQASDGRALSRRFRRYIEGEVSPDSTVVVDLVRGFKPLSRRFPLLDTLEVRPGLDGVCDELRCLPAWQLTLTDAFSENHPLPSIPDVSYGFSAELVRRALGTPAARADLGIEGLARIETESFAADAQGVHRLIRTRTTPPALSQHGVEQAVRAAQRFIVNAQEDDGSFRYAIDPASGNEDRATLNLPRQAGTTYALCELGQGRSVRAAVRRALRAFEPVERRFGELSALQDDRGEFGLGKSALPLLAMLRCRSLAGSENDRLIGGLSRLMLQLQRENGSFYPAFDKRQKRGAGDHEAVYAAGQAVLSLVLLEQQLPELAGSAAEPLPSPGVLKAAIDRAMAYYGGPYWPRPIRDFFFFEEGWHCLAARHALSSHRNEGYEQLCIDYVASRARYVARPDDTSEPDFVGGYGLGDLFPPRNTATAGLGEALNASIAIKQRRGMPVDEDKAMLRDLVTFLLRAQWSGAECYACAKPELIVGGFSQMLASPGIRIDYVQHAMAAIGHGGKLLFPASEGDSRPSP